MPISRKFDVELPENFDWQSYDDVAEIATNIANPNDASAPKKVNAWFGFTAGWVGFAMRFRAAVEYDNEFRSQITRNPSPTRPEQYLQERALFGCISSTLSAIDCFYMAIYCLANSISEQYFPLSLDKDLNKYPRAVAAAYHRFMPQDPFASIVTSSVKSNQLELLSNLRNSLTHRGILPRKTFLSNHTDVPAAIPSNPKSLATAFEHNEHLRQETTLQYVDWAGNELSMLTTEFLKFLRRAVQMQ